MKEYAKILDLREVCKGKRVIVVGDPHGCMDEVKSLLHLVNWKMTKDILIFTGDLIDRGPYVRLMVNFVRHIENVYTVEGNHENKFKRYIKGNPVKWGSLVTTIDAFKWELEEERHRAELYEWLDSLPQIIRFRDSKYITHAGLDPRLSVEVQDPSTCRLMRRFDPATGSYKAEGFPYWYETWVKHHENPPTIYFGHEVHPEASPYVFPGAVALDAGCVYGHHLRAVVIEPDDTETYHSIHAVKQYYHPDMWKTEDK